jgi:hypothetical protein
MTIKSGTEILSLIGNLPKVGAERKLLDDKQLLPVTVIIGKLKY